ncbi:MAG: sulfatase [Microscillaceae bacterium]|nr:sulfatase [Microscillaceae bacterium]
MKKCVHIFFIILLVLGFACNTNQSTPKDVKSLSQKTPPNVIFIMTDDHAYQAISAYSSKLIQTPHIDRLAKEGMRFDRAFVTNSICAPSRAVILTGKFSHLNSVRDNIQRFDSTQQTLPKLMQATGYETAMIGKWHLKSEPTGFDYWKVLPDQGHYYNPDFLTPKGKIQEKGYVTDIITNEAIDWIRSKRDTSRPFMLMYQHKAPHREWWPATEHLKDLQSQKYPEPATLFDDYQGRGKAAKEAEMRINEHMGLSNDNKIQPEIADKKGIKNFLVWYDRIFKNDYARLDEAQKKQWDAVYGPINEDFDKNTPQGKDLLRWKFQRYMQDYLACIRSVDENIGRLLKYLDESGLAENTVVVYTSDQGFYLGEHGWFDKRFMYEESFRTPLLVRWPGKIKAGSVCTELVQNLDIPETLLDIVGAKIPQDMQGKSFKPLLLESNESWRDVIYYHYYEYPGIHAVKRHYGIRSKTHKLIHFYYDVDEWELYDLEKDPQEMKNVYEDAAYKDIREKLLLQLKEAQAQYQDSDSLSMAILENDLKNK